MRLSRLFVRTVRQAPSEADTISHQLLLRAGMVQQLVSGVYSYLPLGWRVLRKIEGIVRQEIEAKGGQELLLPALQPLELWEKTGRHLGFGQTMFALSDRRKRPLVLGPTHEEVVTELVSHHVKSYRDLPLMLYQIQTKFRDEPRPRGGLLRAREFIMKDLYSFDIDEVGLNESYRKMLEAYERIYRRCGLTPKLVEADSGAIGGKESHEFMALTESGEDVVLYCEKCGYAANVEKAAGVKAASVSELLVPLDEVVTPGVKSIDEVAEFLGIEKARTLKAVLYSSHGELVLVVVRGDLEVNEAKVRNALKDTDLRLAREDEILMKGLVPGSASPVGAKQVRRLADSSIMSGTNFVAGANKPDRHLQNVNYPRDFEVDSVLDLAVARAGDGCPRCREPMLSSSAIEIGHVFKLGTFLSSKLSAFSQDKDGQSQPLIMGCYGIGLGRLLAAVIEVNHDERGIIWPLEISPFQVYLCPLYMDNQEVTRIASDQYAELLAAGIEVLLDDREVSPGVKFNDADLLGIPVRLALSPRTLSSHSIEVKLRTEKGAELIPLERLIPHLKELLVSGAGKGRFL